MTNGKGSMSTADHGASWKAGDVSDQFPAGLRVLLVDKDPTCLVILEKMLRTCLYQITTCDRADAALFLLRENKNGFDIVVSEVHMPDMNGFELLQHIGLEMDLPVVLMSADDETSKVMKGMTHGACDYLIKPVRIETLKNIWQHVFRKRKNKGKEVELSGSAEDADYLSFGREGSRRTLKRREDEEDDREDKDNASTSKKPRLTWSVELHQKFVAAVNQLGIHKTVPKRILDLMNVPGITRENVASHLQKYRLRLRRPSRVQYQGNVSKYFINPSKATFGLSPLGGGQSSASNACWKQMALPQSREQTINETSGDNAHGLPPSIGQPMISNAIVGGVLVRNEITEEGRGAGCKAPVPRTYSMENLQLNRTVQLPGNSFFLEGNPAISSLASKGEFQEVLTSNVEGFSGFMPSYDICSDLRRPQSHDLELQDVDTRFDASQHGNFDMPSILASQGASSVQRTGPVTNVSAVGKEMFSMDEGNGQGSIQNLSQHLNTLPVENSVRVEAERVPGTNCQTSVFTEHFGLQEDLMNAIPVQPQEGTGPAEYEEFDIDWFLSHGSYASVGHASCFYL